MVPAENPEELHNQILHLLHTHNLSLYFCYCFIVLAIVTLSRDYWLQEIPNKESRNKTNKTVFFFVFFLKDLQEMWLLEIILVANSPIIMITTAHSLLCVNRVNCDSVLSGLYLIQINKLPSVSFSLSHYLCACAATILMHLFITLIILIK